MPEAIHTGIDNVETKYVGTLYLSLAFHSNFFQLLIFWKILYEYYGNGIISREHNILDENAN